MSFVLSFRPILCFIKLTCALRRRDGVSTFLGLMSSGFPNMFMLYGPQAPTSFSNGPIFLELECEWVRDVLVGMKEDKKAIIDAKQSKEDAWRAKVHHIASYTLISRSDSWYVSDLMR